MKKIFLILCFTGLTLIAVWYINLQFEKGLKRLATPVATIAPLPTVTLIQKPAPHEFQFGEKTYNFYYHKIEDNQTLELIPNFKEATFSANIVKNNNCDFGINGGFYGTNKKALGLFFTNEELIGEKIHSTTFNGFLGKEKTGKIVIISFSDFPNLPDYPNSPYSFLFQTGPLIFLKNTEQPNFLEEDYSRRHLIAKSTAGDYYLFSIFEKNNVFNGPRLKDLREIFLVLGFKKIAEFEMVLNLDGGSASAFYDEGVQVEEFKPIGSFLCGKNT